MQLFIQILIRFKTPFEKERNKISGKLIWKAGKPFRSYVDTMFKKIVAILSKFTSFLST